MSGITRLLAKELSSALGITDTPVAGAVAKGSDDLLESSVDVGTNKQVSNLDYDARIAELDEAPDAVAWQNKAKTFVSESRDVSPSIKTPELEQSTRDLLDNKITREQHLENVDTYKPVNPWDALPREPTDKATAFSLTSRKREDGFFVLPQESASSLGVSKSALQVGDNFNGRLDIPAYTAHDTWIVAGTTRTGEKGTHYAKAIHYTSDGDKPVKFIASNKASEGIGKGEKDKYGYATISGTIKDLDVQTIRSKAERYLRDPEWTQVGFDPRRQGGFYVRAGDNKHVPVREASEVLQIGPLVLARNAVLDIDYAGYAIGGLVQRRTK